MRFRWQISIAVCSVMLGTASAAKTPASAAPPAAFPVGPNSALVQKTCTTCHVPARVTAQRRTAGQWSQIVDQMVAYGAKVSEDDHDKIVAYLTARFGPIARAPK
jgi:Quinohemoprotein amine dehydrogenase A, alpha subunit, haem binding